MAPKRTRIKAMERRGEMKTEKAGRLGRKVDNESESGALRKKQVVALDAAIHIRISNSAINTKENKKIYQEPLNE